MLIKVDIIVYDKNNQDKVLAEHALSKGPRGTWQADLLATDFGLENLTGYYYQYRIKRGDQSVIVLDPYAKSLAAWNSDDANKGPEHKIAKAAFVDPANYGPKDLDYAKIPNFKSREDAIIYEPMSEISPLIRLSQLIETPVWDFRSLCRAFGLS